MQPVHDGVLQIEPTDHCNLRCKMCAPHHEGWDEVHAVPKGTMDMALYETILDGLVASQFLFYTCSYYFKKSSPCIKD